MKLRLVALSEGFIYGYSRMLFSGIDQGARECNVDMVEITCGTLDSVLPEMKIRNILYEHINPDLYDGFIIPYSALGAYAGYDVFQKKLQAVFKKPCITIGGKVPGHPSIIADWETGVRSLTNHLITEHSCKKFLFIRGPEAHIMSNLREKGISAEILAQNDSSYSLETIITEFSYEAGLEFGKKVLSENLYTLFDAFVFVSDSVAAAASQTLLDAGISIPEQIIISACTNAPSGKQLHPLLTTLDEDVVNVGYTAVKTLIEHIQKPNPNLNVVTQPKLLIRESCGCSVEKKAIDMTDEVMTLINYFQLFRQLGFMLLGNPNLSEAFNLLKSELNVDYCSISLFQQDSYPYRESRIMATYNENKPTYYGERGPLTITNQFVPSNIFQEKRRTIIVEPLYHQGRTLGTFCIDYNHHNPLLYEVILSQFSSAVFLNLQHNRLVSAERRFFDMAVISSDWLWETDETGILIYSSGAMDMITGQKTSSLVGKDFFSLLQAKVSGQIEALRKQMLVQKEPLTNIEILSNTHTDDTIFFNLSGKPIYNDAGKFIGFRGVCKDISRAKIAEEQIRVMAYNDMLTGLPNRRLFLDRLETEFRQAKRNKTSFAVMFVDLDSFKSINDTLGHEKGDELLRHVAHTFQECVRGSDTLARVGGDEFVFLLAPIQNKESIVIVAERVMQKFNMRFKNDVEFNTIGASIGIAQYPHDGEDLDTLIRNADEAMYKAKNAGKGGYCFHNETLSRSNETCKKKQRKKQDLPTITLLPIHAIHNDTIIGFRASIQQSEAQRSMKFALKNSNEAEEIETVIKETICLAQASSKIEQWNSRYGTKLFFIYPVSQRKFANTSVFAAFYEGLSSFTLDKNLQIIAIPPDIAISDMEHSVTALEFLTKQNYSLMISGCSTINIPLDIIEKINFKYFGFSSANGEKALRNDRCNILAKTITQSLIYLGGNLFVEGGASKEQLEYFRNLCFSGYMPMSPQKSITLETAERLVASQRRDILGK